MTARSLDAPALRTLARGLPWWARAWWPVATLVGFLALAWNTADVPCTVAAPCPVEPVWNAGLGSLLAGAALTAVSGWGAVAATVLGLALTAGSDDPAWLWAAAVGHVLVQVLVAHRRARVPRPATTVPGPVGAALVPDAAVLPRISAALLGALALTVVLTGLATVLQWHADAAQDAAPVVEGTVTSQDEEDFTIGVDLAGGGTVEVDVYDAAEHPVGSTTRVWRFPDGSARLVAEPYDAWGATTGAGAGLALALAAAARLGTRHARRRAFLTTGQPLWRARARVLPGIAFVHPLDAAPDDEPVLALALPYDEDVFDAFSEDEDAGLPDAVPVELAGLPLPGHWCAVRVDGRWLPVLDAAAAGDGGPPLVLPEVVFDEDGLPVLEVPTADLAPWDVVPMDGPVTDAGAQRVPAAVGLLLAAPALLVSAFGLDRVDDLLGGRVPRPVAAAVLGLLGLELVWRLHLRPRVDWDTDGLTVVGAFGPGRRFGWERLVEAEPVPRGGLGLTLVLDGDTGTDDEPGVLVTEVEVATASERVPARWRGSWRTRTELRAALLQARDSGRRDRRPVERTPAPSRPALPAVVWALVVAVSWLGGRA